MITLEDFLQEVNDYENCLTSFLLVGADAERVIGALNVIDPGLKPMGGACSGGNTYFVGGDIPAEIIYDLTRILGVTGYADNVFDPISFICAKDGSDCDDYYAEWEPDGHYQAIDDGGMWTCLLKITDKATGAVFHTGTGPVSDDIAELYTDIVENHRPEDDNNSAEAYKNIVIKNAEIELRNYEANLLSQDITEIRSKAEEYGAMVECLNTLMDADNICENYMSSGKGYDLRKMTKADWKALSETENVLSKMAKDSYWCKEEYYAGMYDVMLSMGATDDARECI